MRRGLKIWPSYFAAYGTIAIYGMIRTGTLGGPSDLAAQLPNFFFLQNYIHPEHRWFASWSLAVEEHFYLLCPLVLLAGASLRKTSAIPLICGGICVVVLLFRGLAVAAGVDSGLLYIQTHYRVDALALGVLIGYWHGQNRLPICKRPLLMMVAAFIAALLIPFVFLEERAFLEICGGSLVAILFCVCVSVAGQYPDLFDRHGKMIQFTAAVLSLIGIYSYTIYLSQEAILILNGKVPWLLFGLSRLLFFVFGSIFCGVLLSHVVERPFLRLRERRFA